MWLIFSFSLFSILCFSEVFPGKSFHFSTFVLSDQLSCLYPVFVATVAAHYWVHLHSAAGRMITATARGAEGAGLWVLHLQATGSRVGWSSGPLTAKHPKSPLACSLPELRELESHLHLWQETFLSCSRCSCPPDKGHSICLHRQTRQTLHRDTGPCTAWGISKSLSALQCIWVHIKFIPASTSWAGLEDALKVLLQASQMDRRWIWPRALSLSCCCTTVELSSRD